ncbi:MAG: hypothetical protein D6675_07660 [Gemmatimonadetes bacterium]|nr:MAG: hypothetical protein D6675_07660 [Gemmatimonadota bacterium]
MKFISLSIAKYRLSLWILAVIITLSSAYYQRRTGPSYPVKGQIKIDQTNVRFKLIRSETVGRDAVVKLIVPLEHVGGFVKYRRYRSNDGWSEIPLRREGDHLIAHLPQQPAAGKLMYYVYLHINGQHVSLSGENPVILRYKDAIPVAVLASHIGCMFIAMLFSNRILLEALDAEGNTRGLLNLTIGFLILGGMILGPIVQKFAFGAYWTGFPLGHDLTDNKTLIALTGWVVAWVKHHQRQQDRFWIFAAAVLMLVVYLIPHSLLGSELDYIQIDP